jgi:hypothetical protein
LSQFKALSAYPFICWKTFRSCPPFCVMIMQCAMLLSTRAHVVLILL